MELKRVVITGIGAITPLGNTANEYWNNLIKGANGCDLITRFDTSKFKTRFACQVKNYNSEEYFDRRELRKLDLFAQYAMIAADEAIIDAKLNLDSIDKDNVGVIFSSGIGGIEVFFQEVKSYVTGDGTPRYSPFFIPKMISDITAGHISIKYGFRGPNYGTVSACATSSNSIIDAYNLIRLGKAIAFVTGGAEAAINEPGMAGFNALQAISTNNDEYKTASRPFDATRDGFVMGEGAGALILEEYEHAKKRGVPVYAELVGGGMSADAYHVTAPHPEGDGAVLVMNRALEDAQMKPDEIDYINLHGTATPRGDISEVKAVKKVFGDYAYKLNISSSKSMTGHLLGAAGAVEAIATLMAVKENNIPPTINFKKEDPEIDYKLNFTFNKAQQREVRAALSNTFGFGGHNTSVIFKKFQS